MTLQTTPAMRALIKELSYPAQDDYDRAVQMLLADFETVLARLQASESLKVEYIEGHNKLAERVGVLDAALRNFADPANWYEKVGCQQWMGKRDARDLAESALNVTQER